MIKQLTINTNTFYEYDLGASMKKTSFYSSLNNQEKYILICCFFVFAVNGLYAMILGSLLPLLSNEYQLNNTISGGLISAHQTGNLISGFIAGILPVYLGRKKAILFLCSFVIVGFLIMMTTGNPVLLILSFLFTGLSRGSISNFNNTVVNEVSNSNSGALNFLHSTFAIGALLGPFLVIATTTIAGPRGWRIATTIIIVLALISMLMFTKMTIEPLTKKTKNNLSYRFLKDTNFITGCGIFFFYLCTESAITGWLVKYFVDSNLMSTQYAQMLNSLLWVVILAGRITTIFISTRLSTKLILSLASVGTLSFYTFLLLSNTLGPITFAIMGLGFSMSALYPTAVANVGKTIREFPMAMGVILFIGGIGAILMPLITGALSDKLGIFAGMFAIVIAILMMILCIILSWFMGINKAVVN